MRIDKSQISGNRFMFTVACFIQASSLLTAFLSTVTGQDSWIVIIFGFLFRLPLLWLYRTLIVNFPDKNLIQLLEYVYGAVPGKIIGVMYIGFFITLTALNLSELSNFVQLTIMDETPDIVLAIMCMIVAAWAVRFGLRIVTRYGPLFVFVSSLIVFFSCLTLIKQFDFENFLPVFDKPVMKYVQGTHIISTIPFGELVAILMITPNVKMSRRETTKYLFWGFTLGAVTLLLIKLRDIAILGDLFNIFTIPSLIALRLINIGEAFSRVEILFSIILIMLLFFKITILYYISVIAISQIMVINKFINIVLAVGTFIVYYSLTLNPSPIEYTISAKESTPFIWTIFELVIPILTFIVAKMRKLSPTPVPKEV